jgi:CRP/FNR family transcriptional regulator, cyclic AMP receptor protein
MADERQAGLARSYLFERLPAADLAPLAAAATTRVVERDEHVWRAGDRADELYVVLRGEVADCVLDADGRLVVHTIHGPGMTLGEPGYFSAERDRSVSSVALVRATLIRVDRRDLDPFLERHPPLKDRALQGLAGTVRWAGSMMASLATRSLSDRVVLRLLELADANPQRRGGHPATPPITQATLAAMTGVSRENVNRALAALATAGLVRRDGNRYVLLDDARLRREVARDWPVFARRDRRQV